MLNLAISAGAQEEKAVFVYNDNGNRDPLLQLVSKNGVINNYDTDFLITDLTLEGIIAGTGEGNFAIINGQIVKVNDKVGKYFISNIDSSAVYLSNGQETHILQLKKGE